MSMSTDAKAAWAGIGFGVIGVATMLAASTMLFTSESAESSSDPVPAVEETETVKTTTNLTWDPAVTSFVVETNDNREVFCVYAGAYKQGGLSCDWANAVAK